jgi:hypothetical protein
MDSPKRITGFSFRVLLWILVGAAVAYFFIAYLVVTYDPATRLRYDGWGRPLVEASGFERWIILNGEKHWTGWGWFLADIGLYLVALATGYALHKQARRFGGYNN